MLNTISGLLGGGAPAGGDYESIATVTASSGSLSTITFSSIPSTYSHLQIRALGRSDTGSAGAQVANMQFNSDTGNNYSSHNLQGNGSSVTSSAVTSTNGIYTLWAPQGEAAGAFGVAVIDILDYANTNKYKTSRTLYGAQTNATFNVAALRSGSWRSTSAISSITFTLTAFSFEQYSTFALYGIK